MVHEFIVISLSQIYKLYNCRNVVHTYEYSNEKRGEKKELFFVPNSS